MLQTDFNGYKATLNSWCHYDYHECTIFVYFSKENC